MQPKVSVIIPAYNYAAYVAEAIQSVLDQTYQDFELVAVDDGSTDDTAAVIRSFKDPRVKYVYQENRGLPAARNTGIRASGGEILAFLDADDRYHPHKLAAQVEFLEGRPEVGLSYSARFMVDGGGNILFLQRVPDEVDLKDLVSGYPVTPSDVVVRREWAERVGLFDESFALNSEDLNFHLRLALEGCRFAGLERALGYRRIHPSRAFRNIPGKLATFLRALDTAFEDPRCPPDVLTLRPKAYASHTLAWAYQAAVQAEPDRAKEYFRQAVALNPDLLQTGSERGLVDFMVHASIRDGGEHEERLNKAFASLPEELSSLSKCREEAIGSGTVRRAIREVMWGFLAGGEGPEGTGRLQKGEALFDEAARRGAGLDQATLNGLVDQVVGCEVEFGPQAARDVLAMLQPQLRKIASGAQVRNLIGSQTANRAFRDFDQGRYSQAGPGMLSAIRQDPALLADRGALAVLVRSLLHTFSKG